MRRLQADIAVVGAGSGGLSVAAGAAQLGQRVVLFEKGEMGGDCLNTGCVPSKALIAAACAAHAVRDAGRLGVHAGEPRIDFGEVMAHVRGAIAAIAPHDSQQRFEALGVTVVREQARFAGPRTLASDGIEVTAQRIVLATGSRPKVPPIPGLAEAAFLTNETVFGLQVLPQHLIVLGAGPIGLELGQAFRRLGARVTVIEADQPLPREDADLRGPVLEQLAADGVALLAGRKAERVESPAGGGVAVVAGGERIEGSHLLVAVGREPVIEGLELDAGGVAHDRQGITVDAGLRSVSNRAVFAVGDVAGRGQFTHLAGAHAGLFIRKALFAQRTDADALVVPRVTYTDPEIASVGLTEAQAREAHGNAVKVLTAPFAGNDRAIAEGDVRGFAKLVLDRGGRLLGAGLVGRGAGELIQPWVMALATGRKLRDFTAWVAPYPTRGEIHRKLASGWFSPILFSDRTRLLVSLLKRFS